ncbi:MAG: NAD-glutamate dehydrogenase [Rhodocyclaceae bacterium]|nr:NAD-glutamate dehydrogenase [Rhodocyclaceae bacterium]
MNRSEQLKAELIAGVIGLLAQKLPAEETREAVAFIELFYSQVDPEDLLDRQMLDLYGAALAQWQFWRQFNAPGPKLHVYNPSTLGHGWQSTHTVIEILSPDMPFLVDSIAMEVNRQGLTVHLIIHPVLRTRRDADGKVVDFGPAGTSDPDPHESVIHVEVDRRTDPAALAELERGLLGVLSDVRAAVQDWRKMQHRLVEALAEVEQNPPPQDPAETTEDRAFLQWVREDNFLLLGYREYELAQENGEQSLRVVRGTGLGILREKGTETSKPVSQMSPELQQVVRGPALLIITKSNSRCTVHRPGYLDHVGIKRFDSSGKVIGERRILGMFTSTAYNAVPSDIPLLRRKVAKVLQRTGFLPRSHAAKALKTILEQYPRDELLQISVDELLNISTGILHLAERQRTRLFIRREMFGRYYTCLVYVPRENYHTGLRERMQAVLMEALHGLHSEFNVQLSESVLARIYIVIHAEPGSLPQVDERDIERRLVMAGRTWHDDLRDALLEHCGEERGNTMFARFRCGFPAAYREDVTARAAVHDIEAMSRLQPDGELAMNLYVPLEAAPGNLRFKVIRARDPVPLSVSLPMLEHMGVRVLEERPYRIDATDGTSYWIHDFGMSTGRGEPVDAQAVQCLFQDAFANVWRGSVEDDDFNRLVLAAGLSWREVVVLRAYAKYLKQTAFTFSQTYMKQTLATHAGLARKLVELFHARFDPDAEIGMEDRAERAASIVGQISTALDRVANLDEDRILRQFLAAIQATVRTNYYQLDAHRQPRPWLSFKIDPAKIPQMPEPRPMWEIFVYSPRVEGVHLRGGRVARGGLRWSDRMEDFRTEVLGLMKAQMVKNAVIVPVGSKGGFVVKLPPPGGDREALLREGITCYQNYLRGMLDLTDNLAAGEVVPPDRVVRHDPDDTYLVVAADKGTAAFSDYANAVAREYGFWLGDAFASGGSAGYDHKKMAITARGAWESAKRHFRELGCNTQEQDFTVVGVGDMSGDVFGNGMLQSRHIKLVAAFDHRHVFLDPNPDPELAYLERQRMFALPRSSWDDYEKQLISPGGGVWSRSAKSIPLSDQMRALLGCDAQSLTPVELIRACLLAPVDLLYNGGIGTYVKASTEANADVGDRANDAIRVNGNELRCKVVCEGGNLGCTQRGRIEFALGGGKINTDAIDNSGGVDCSDHEVNIKILVNAVVAAGDLTEKQRNQLLADMTEEVAQLVLRDNYFQNQVLSVVRARGVAMLDDQARYMRYLGNSGRLNRKLEFLPFDEEIGERKLHGNGLMTPELSVLLAYSKMELYETVLASDVPEDPFICTALQRYFPKPLRERFPDPIQLHPLKREIISTHVINSMVNRVGPTFVFRMREETGASAPDIVRAYMATREIFGLVELWQHIEALDNQVAHATQLKLIDDAARLILRGTLWFLRHRAALSNLATTLARYAPGVALVGARLYELVVEQYRTHLNTTTAHYVELGAPPALARQVAGLAELYSGLDIVDVAGETGRDTALVASVYFSVGGWLDLHWLSAQVSALPADNHWQTLARAALREDLSLHARNIAAEVLRTSPELSERDALIDAWKTGRRYQIERWRQVVADLQTAGSLDIPMVSVAMRELRAIV